MSSFKSLFSFPNPANDVAARMVAGMVILMAAAVLVFDQTWVLFIMTYGFLARVASGPRFSPASLLATRVIVPFFKIPERPVPGPPKRFAQGIGLVFTATVTVLHFGFGLTTAANVLLGILLLFASLEAFLAFCAGCFAFNLMIRWKLLPESVCRECVFRPDPALLAEG
ncbi:MAG: DUF4395 domain-containing protein [SAR202 cluster bacterium]|nr:DUF4395 domain-containing protein [SAR202 cluster bacterium]